MRRSLLHPPLMHLLRSLFSAALLRNLPAKLLPGCCALCGANHSSLLCEPCLSGHITKHHIRCIRCAIDMTTLHAQCGRCQADPPAFDATFTVASYAPPIDQLVLALKFRGQLAYAAAFANLLLREVPSEAVNGAGLIVAIPLSVERLAQRGFNQAHEMAKPLARAWQLPLATDVCLRVRDTEAQSALALDRRQDNMRGAFAVARREAVAGQHVLVVDDVMTTGHTLNALAACLKRHGATRVTNLVFARTPLR